MSELAQWQKVPLIAVMMGAARFTLALLKDVSSTIWIWLALYLAIKNVPLVIGVMLTGLFITGLVIHAIRSHFYRYRFADDTLHIQSGVFSKLDVHLPLNRVLNVEISQPYLYRLGDYVSAVFDSAGQKKKDGLIPAIKRDVAEALKQKVMVPTNVGSEDGVATVHAPSHNDIIDRGVWDLFVFGLCQNRIFVFAGILVGLYYKIKEVVKDFNEQVVAVYQHYIDWLGIEGAVLGSALITMLLIALSAIASGVIQIGQSYGYRLSASKEGLSQVEGLFTRKNNHIQLQKLQRIVIRETFFDRLVKRCSVILYQLNGQMVVPALRQREIDKVVQSVYPDVTLSKVRFTRLSVYPVIQSLLLYSAPLSYLGYVAFTIDRAGFGLAFTLLSLGILMVSTAKWYRLGFAFDCGFVFVRDGRFDQRIYCVDWTKLQNVSISQFAIEKLFGIATVKLHFGGKTLRLHGVRDYDAEQIYKDGIGCVNSYHGRWT